MVGRSKKSIAVKMHSKDPIDRILILLDGDENLGVRGMRWRLSRLEKIVFLLLGIELVGAILALAGSGESGNAIGIFLQSLILFITP